MILFFINDQYDIFEYFLKIGADPNVKYKGNPINTGNKYYEYILENDTPLFLYATERLYRLSKNYNRNRDINNIDIVKEEKKISEIMDMLLEKGVDPYISDKYSRVSLEIVMNMDPFPHKDDYKKYWIKELIDYAKNASQLVRYFVYLLKNFKKIIYYKDIFTFFLNKGGIQIIQECYNQNILILKGLMDSFNGNLKDNVATLEVMEFLIANGASVDEMDSNGYTLLHKLLESHKIKKAMWLLQHGANPNLLRPDGKTPINYALETEDNDSVKILFGKYRMEENDPDNDKNSIILNYNIITKIDMSLTEKDILLIAASKRYNSDIIGLLMEAGADTKVVDEYEHSALDTAAYYGNSLVCQALLDNDFDANTQTSTSEETSLFVAVKNENENDNADIILQILIQNGCDPDLPDVNGNTPLIVAASKKPEDKTDTDKEIVELLIEYEANIEHKNLNHKSAFDLATKDIKPIIKKALKTMENRRNGRFDSSRIKVDENREVIMKREVTDLFEGTETLLPDYLMLDPNNKVLIIDKITLGINAKSFLNQYYSTSEVFTDIDNRRNSRKNRYDNKYYECKRVQRHWPSRDDIEWTTSAMLNLRNVGAPGGLVDFDNFFALLNSPHRLFELREIRQIPAIAGLQMLHHNRDASSSEHCQGGTVFRYYNIMKIEDESDRSPNKSKTKLIRTASSKYKTRGTSPSGSSRGGKKTRRRRQKV